MKVASDAIRLVSRMNRDWIVQGRRPSGICGACLLLAARMNNYRRSVREVVYVVKVADLTIQKRLEEFKLTNSSSLTVDEFRSLWLEQAHDPPSFGPKMKKRKRVREVNGDGEVIGDTEDQAIDDDSSNADSNSPTTTVNGTSVESTPPVARRDTDGFAVPEIPIDPALLIDPALFDRNATASASKILRTPEVTQPPPTTAAPGDTTDAHIESIADAAIESEITTIMSSTDSLTAATSLEADIEAAKQAEKEAADAAWLRKRRSSSVLSTVIEATGAATAGNDGNDPITLDSSGSAPIWGESNVEMENNDDGDLSLCDDWETDSALLTPEESLIKERIWTELNKEYIKEQEAKKLKAERDARNGVGKSSRKRRGGGKGGRGRGGSGGGRQIAASPAESAKEMLAKRAYSKKINYAALDHLFSED